MNQTNNQSRLHGQTIKFDYARRRLTSPSEIRLISLHPGEFEADLVIDIHVVGPLEWQESDSYEALSHLWGPPVYDHFVTCDGCTLAVTKSLNCALRHLRQLDTSRSLWIDAICIDQTNVEERNQQTLLMHDVYRNARAVIAWLGEQGHDSEFPMMLGNHQVGFFEDEPECSPSALYLHMAKFSSLDKLRPRFIAFFQRQWFSRTWILQEVALAKVLKVQCGMRCVSWEDIEILLHIIRDRLLYEMSDLVTFETLEPAMDLMVARDRVQAGKPVSALAAYKFSRRFEATDPRDRVYGLRGVMHFEERRAIIPDYRKREEEVFRDTTRSLLLNKDTLEWLSYARPVYETVSLTVRDVQFEGSHIKRHGNNPQMQRSNLPSWAVDWALTDEPDDDTNPHSRQVRQLDIPENDYKASGGTKPRFAPQPDPGTLRLEGRVIGELQSCVRAFQRSALVHCDQNFPERSIEQTFWLAHLRCTTLAIEHIKDDIYKPSGELRAEAIWRTLIANRWSVPIDIVHPGEVNSLGESWLSRLFSLMRIKDPAQQYKWSVVAYDRFLYEQRLARRRLTAAEQQEILPTVVAWNSMSTGVLGRCFCAIGDDYLGLCPPTAKEGDLVVALYGGNVPYVLRRVAPHAIDPASAPQGSEANASPPFDESWQLVGEAYVHGCMDGEVFRLEYKSTDRVFNIV